MSTIPYIYASMEIEQMIVRGALPYSLYALITCNARLNSATLDTYCPMSPQTRQIMNEASDKLGLSNRAYTRVLKVARTIADLEDSKDITGDHVSEALQYRMIDAKYWG